MNDAKEEYQPSLSRLPPRPHLAIGIKHTYHTTGTGYMVLVLRSEIKNKIAKDKITNNEQKKDKRNEPFLQGTRPNSKLART